MLNHKIDFDNRQAVHEQIIFSNTLMFGALAWRGYQLKRLGAIIICQLKKRKSSFEESKVLMLKSIISLKRNLSKVTKKQLGYSSCWMNTIQSTKWSSVLFIQRPDGLTLTV
jgi:stage III sporulation protein SpoIIIAA